ncbi:MAG: hypothetical protein K6E91_14680 [Butyrivibrio sp.]|nr:hypothetical protein [Butyrivibrio sp.]
MLKRIEDIRSKGLEGKLIRFVVIFVFCIGAAFLAVSYIQVSHLGDVVDEESEKQALLVQESVRGAMGAPTVDSLY